MGRKGVAALARDVRARPRAGLIVLMDGKRNDIGSTAEAYARGYLGKSRRRPVRASWDVDALTVNPYLGIDGIPPFVKVATREGKGIFVLVRTSNASAREFQDLVADGRPLYRHVAERLAGWAAPHRGSRATASSARWSGRPTPPSWPSSAQALPGVPFLVPGYGTQGGVAADVAPAFDEDGLGALINNSRGITFAYRKPAALARFGDDWRGRGRPGRPGHGGRPRGPLPGRKLAKGDPESQHQAGGGPLIIRRVG